jgi:hypothetical protein
MGNELCLLILNALLGYKHAAADVSNWASDELVEIVYLIIHLSS